MPANPQIKAVPTAKKSRKRLRSPNPEVRARLLAAANEFITEEGFPSLRVDEVSERAGLSVGTFYLYFDGKDDLFTALVVEHTRRLREGAQAAYASPGSVMQRLARGLQAYLDFVEANDRGFLYFRNSRSVDTTVGNLSTWAFEQHAADLQPLIEEGMRTGELRQQDARLLTQSLLGLMQHLAGYWLEHRSDINRDQLIEFLARLSSTLSRP